MLLGVSSVNKEVEIKSKNEAYDHLPMVDPGGG